MAIATYDLIDSVTLGGSASSITFSGIPQTYAHLVVTGDYIGSTGQQILLEFNGDSTESNYDYIDLRLSSTSVSSGGSNLNYIGRQSTNISGIIIDIFDYTASKWGAALARYGNPEADNNSDLWLTHLRWENTAAITSVSVVSSFATLSAGSNFYLWGVA